MARYRGPRLKKCRQVGVVLPGLTNRGMLKRANPPGQHGARRKTKPSDYKERLMEKQKLRFHYGLSERQLRRYVAQAFAGKGNSGHVLLQLLERRLDNVVFRAGFAPTMAAARQMVLHRHVTVNDKRVNIPSYQMRAGDTVQLNDKSKMKPRAIEAQKDPNNLKVPDYLEAADGVAKMKMLPERDAVPVDLDPQLIVEYYSGK